MYKTEGFEFWSDSCKVNRLRYITVDSPQGD